jgi:hypothetical protein
VLAGAERQAAQHGDLAAAEAAQRAERATGLRAVQLDGVLDDGALAGDAVGVQPVPGPTTSAAGRPVSHAARQAAGVVLPMPISPPTRTVIPSAAAAGPAPGRRRRRRRRARSTAPAHG